MIACDTCTQRSAIVVFDAWPAGRANAHATDSLWGAHAYGENSLPTPNLAPKTGSISGPTICSLPYWAGFGGRWLVCDCETGPRNSAFFLLLPYHLGLNIWSAWPQLQRFSVCQTGLTTKTSTCSKYPRAIQIICAQNSYYDYKRTHTCIYIYICITRSEVRSIDRQHHTRLLLQGAPRRVTQTLLQRKKSPRVSSNNESLTKHFLQRN